MQDFSQWAFRDFWYKSVYGSNPSLRASSLFWGNREKLHESLSRGPLRSPVEMESLLNRAKLIRDLTRELNGVKLL